MRIRIAALVLFGSMLAAPPGRGQTTGLIPMTDLGAGTYSGFQGGLYPGGVNAAPAVHLTDALAKAAEIVPRNAAGVADSDGWIGMIAIGMSNTTHEFGAFERNADADPGRNARVVIVDTGFGGQTATIIADPAAAYWTTMMSRLTVMGLTAQQVQVAWLKEAEAVPPNNFPLHATALRDTLKKVVHNLHVKFPNLKICYLSSRIYGGYSAPGTLNPEPQAYESGFSVKWLIEDQINGDPGLNYGRLPGDVRAPLLLWGPYLWVDGVNPRSDGLTWPITDLENDHVHPSPSGEQKVAGLLSSFFAGDATAAPWWPVQSGDVLVALDALHDSHVSAAAPSTNFGSAGLLLAQGGASPINTYVRFDVSGESRPIRFAKLSLRVSQIGGGFVRRVDDATWNENSITWATAPPIGAALATLPQSSKDGTIGANVTPTILADADGQVSFALTTPSAGQATYLSDEGGQPPRIVLVVSTGMSAVSGPPARPRRRLREVGPSPAFREAHVTFDMPAPEAVSLAVYSVDGRLVRTLFTGESAAGRHDVWWDGRDSAGNEVRSGCYLVRLEAGGIMESGKVMLLR